MSAELRLTDRERDGWVRPDALDVAPGWLAPIVRATRDVRPDDLSLFLPPPAGGRQGSVLMLFGQGAGGPDVLIIERARDMRSHAGQPAFPGGAVDPGDDGAVGAALREAWEETDLDPGGVEVLGALPALWLPPSGFVVSPVVAWWRNPSPVRVRHPSGYVGPGFTVRGMLVWGFTGGILSRIFAAAGLEIGWEPARVVEVGWSA